VFEIGNLAWLYILMYDSTYGLACNKFDMDRRYIKDHSTTPLTSWNQRSFQFLESFSNDHCGKLDL
jgi:hypothetical protein